MSIDLDAILDRVNANAKSDEEIPAPGSPDNPWIGIHRMVNGQRQFYALSGADRRRAARADARFNAKRQAAGQRAYNRQERQKQFDLQTVRAQYRILNGDIAVTPAMMNNLVGHIERQQHINIRRDNEPERRERQANRRAERLRQRQQARLAAGQRRHKDLIAAYGDY